MRSGKRALVVSYVVLVALALAVGCSTKDDPSEVLDLCGNHSCGNLAMVTIDTSKDGFQYLEPALSPDQSTIAFTADWGAIPSLPPPVDPIPLTRQILVMPIDPAVWRPSGVLRKPVTSLTQLGASLVRCNEFLARTANGERLTDNAHRFNKGHPTWLRRPGSVASDSLVFWINVNGRDRLVVAGIQDPGNVTPRIIFYEQQDLVESGWFFYHHDPEISEDGRWVVFTRFGCDRPNAEDRNCTLQTIWVLDMWTTSNPVTARAFPVTSGSAGMMTPTWSPDGRKICFSSRTDLVGESGGRVWELFTIDFDPEAAAISDPELDLGLNRITFTSADDGDPSTGLSNYSPVFDRTGANVYFVSSRRAPATATRERNIWSVVANGRLEPTLIFFSRQDDVDPDVADDGTVLLASGMGFPTQMLDANEAATLDSLHAINANAPFPKTEFEIRRLARDERTTLETYGSGVMKHLYLLRDW